jgi:hypothetical protein
MASTDLASECLQHISLLMQKVEASQQNWNDRVGEQFRTAVQSGLQTPAQQFAREVEYMEALLRQAKSKVP